MSKSNLTRLITLLAVILTTFQAAIPSMPLTDTVLISAVVMFLVLTLTAWKQYLSVEIKDGAIWPTAIIFAVTVLGGINDFIGVINLSPVTAQWLRFGVTTLTMILNISSKTLFPSEDGKVIEQAKKDLSTTNNFYKN